MSLALAELVLPQTNCLSCFFFVGLHHKGNEVGSALKGHLSEFVVNALVNIMDFPRSTIRVVVQEVNNDGGMLACAINATCLALMDAGVPMNGMFAATTCTYSGSKLMLDSTLEEEQVCCAS